MSQSARLAEAPDTSPLLFWSFVLSTVGLFTIGSLVAVGPADPVESAFANGRMWHVVIVEVFLAAIWLPVLRRRGWSLACMTTSPVTEDLAHALGLLTLCYCGVLLVSLAIGLISPSLWQASQGTRPHVSVGLDAILAVSIVNPMAEEFVYLGFIANLLRRRGVHTAAAASVAARAVVHLYQGPLRLAGIVVAGIVLSMYYWRTRRLWAVVFAHGFMDATNMCLR
jgi:membrane protease YdiL (CAAX protease family)